jgi:hypothetical protein
LIGEKGYIFGDEEGTVEVSEEFSDLMNLARTDISKVDEDHLLMLSKQGIQSLDGLNFLKSFLSSTSHFSLVKN